MKWRVKYGFLLLAILAYRNVYAQFTGTSKKWTIEDCIQYATDHNIQVNLQRLNEQASYEDLAAARAAKIPDLSATFNHSFNNSKNNVSGNADLVSQLTSSGNYLLNSSVVIWNNNYLNNNIHQDELMSQSAGFSVQQYINDITLSITQAYLAILLGKENLKYAIDLDSATEAAVRQGQMFYDAGSIAKKDLLQLQAQLASDKYLLVQTQNTIRQNILALKQILQLPAETSFDIETPEVVEVTPVLTPLAEAKEKAIRDFPEIKIGDLGVNIAALDIAKAKAGFKPVLKANALVGSGYSDVMTNAVLPKTAYSTQLSNNFYQQLGLTLSVPIFSNRINKTNLAKANISYRQANLSLENDKLVLSQQVEQAYLNVINAQQSYDAANQQLRAAIESYRIVNEEFRLGAINSFDLLQQRNQYVLAVQAFTQAKYTAILQQKIYEFYLGKPVSL